MSFQKLTSCAVRVTRLLGKSHTPAWRIFSTTAKKQFNLKEVNVKGGGKPKQFKFTWPSLEVDPFDPSIQKRKSPSHLSNKMHLNVTAYAVAKEMLLKDLSLGLRNDPVYMECSLPSDLASNALLMTSRLDSPDESKRDIIVFRNGAVVFWNLAQEEQYLVMDMLSQYRAEPYFVKLILEQAEEMPFYFTEKSSHINGDFIWLHKSSGPIKDAEGTLDQTVLDQYAYSHALALAVKLNILEDSFNIQAAYLKPWIEKLRSGRLFFLTQNPVTKQTGELLTLRHLVNVSSEFVDTPEIYWERYEMEPVFNSLKKQLSIYSRTIILNQKLDFSCEVLDILTSHLSSRHSSRLEIMIIVLILIEVMFEVMHYRNSRTASVKNVILETQPSIS